MTMSLDPERLVRLLVDGDTRALARAISVTEDGRTGAERVLELAYPAGGSARVVGVTGAPGSGKSTLVSKLIEHCRSRGERVAVVAVDPSSPISGGSVLGDRIRMQDHVDDPSVFVRSMSSRGHLGGLADATAKAICLIDAAGYDTILVETVGVGQSEVEVAVDSDTTVVVVTPGWGDSVQAAKAGLLEVGHVFVVNKADRPGADEAAAALTEMLEMGGEHRQWVPPVVSTSARDGVGITHLADALDRHAAFLSEGRRLDETRRRRALAEIRRAVRSRVAVAENRIAPELVDAVAARRTDPWTAAAALDGSGQD
jgi:LAO/AO transport system kinase